MTHRILFTFCIAISTLFHTSLAHDAFLPRKVLAKLPRGGGGRNDDYYYNDYGRDDPYRDEREDDPYRYEDERSSPKLPSVSRIQNAIKYGDRQIGILLLGSGAAITMLGISLFFNKALMRLGNLLFIFGVPVTIGPTRTMGYFLRPEKARATSCLALGIVLVFIGWPLFGMILEAFGLLNLFGNMFPVVAAIARTMPGIGPLFAKRNDDSRRRRDDDYYQEDDYPYQADDDYVDRGYDDARGYDKFY